LSERKSEARKRKDKGGDKVGNKKEFEREGEQTRRMGLLLCLKSCTLLGSALMSSQECRSWVWVWCSFWVGHVVLMCWRPCCWEQCWVMKCSECRQGWRGGSGGSGSIQCIRMPKSQEELGRA